MKKYASRMILGALVIAVLIIAFRFNGSQGPITLKTESGFVPRVTDKAEQPDNKDSDLPQKNETDNTDSAAESGGDAVHGNDGGAETNENFGGHESVRTEHTDGAAENDKTENGAENDKELYCTLSVRCDTILDNMSALNPEKVSIIPADGVVLSERQVEFFEGETVFNLLKRELKKNKIHMEFANTPAYNSAYIEGIANIYEYDCGELSGWMYRVNGQFPNYGCSQYKLSSGDKVEWLYTCDLGADIGGGYRADGGQKNE